MDTGSKNIWETYEEYLNNLMKGEGLFSKKRALMVRGGTGTGKTYTFEAFAKKYRIVLYHSDYDMQPNSDEYDYATFSGHIGFRELQRLLYKHRNKLVVFDNLDSMWYDRKLAQMIKNALDPSGDGTVQWVTTLNDEELGKIPSTYKFTGKILFITNLTKEELIKKGVNSVVEQCCVSIDIKPSYAEMMDYMDRISSDTLKEWEEGYEPGRDNEAEENIIVPRKQNENIVVYNERPIIKPNEGQSSPIVEQFKASLLGAIKQIGLQKKSSTICYLCGQRGADYRRTVETGQSRGSYSSYGSRGGYRYGNSSRTYTGTRSVCEECAFGIDKQRLLSGITGEIIIITILSVLILLFI